MRKDEFADKVTISKEARRLYNMSSSLETTRVEEHYSKRNSTESPDPMWLYFIVFSCAFSTLTLAYVLAEKVIVPFLSYMMEVFP